MSKYQHIPYEKWLTIVSTDPLRYKKMYHEYMSTKRKMYFRSKKKTQTFKKEVYAFFTDMLHDQTIILGEEKGIRDTDRKEIDTIVIHHTHHTPGIDLTELSAIELIRLYTPYYAKPTQADKHKAIGKPISSGHIRQEQQVFRPYHRIIREDGTYERLLKDKEIGRHAGKREVNCRSVAIVIDDNVEHKKPSKKQIASIRKIITTYYPHISHENILGHCETNPTTVCPGEYFLGKEGWKQDILK